MLNRRQTLQHSWAVATLLGTAGLVPFKAIAYDKAAFEAKSVAAALKALGASAPLASADVTLNGPEIADNGASVLLSFGTTLPNVKRVLLLVEKNPAALVANFQTSPVVDSQFSLRIKMSQSSDVFAVAVTQDGKAYFAKRDIKVTLGGCGE
ncbi:thiosulfate oxidation carrier protein SoxY [Limnohabitans sp.]|uniref:thiosulfate oxidation carrier protein SoxY n=1 Tax=Limnohabitans sp. TaxID=1907725 RepID=UPI002FDD2544